MMKPDLLLKYLTATSLILVLLLGYTRPITALTQDLGRHLLTGEIILKTLSVPRVNLYSYTYPDFPFLNHHWGSEVVFSLLHSIFGFPGLFVLMLLLVTGALLLQIHRVFSHVSALALGTTGLLYLGVLFERVDLRPELFSFFLLSVFVTLLYRNRDKPTKLIYLLIPLQLLWVNLHIYFAVGLIVIFLFVLDAAITHRKKLKSPVVLHLAAVLALSGLISLINPHGINGLLYPLTVFDNYGYTIEENQTVFFLMQLGFNKPSFPYFFGSLLLLFTSLGINYKKTKPVDWLLACAFTYLGFSAVRNFPLFVFATFIPATLFFTFLLSKIPPITSLKPYRLHLTAGILLCFFIWQGAKQINDHPVTYAVSPGAEKAADFFIRERLSGPIFNNFDIGSYLIYRLYPKERVFVDGRPEAYPEAFFGLSLIPMQENPPDFTEATKHYNFTTIFFSHTDQTPWGISFLTAIVNDPAWSIVYLDDYVIILVKKTPENETLIKRFGMTRENLRLTKTEETFEANLRLVSFFTKIGWYDEALVSAEALLREKPKFCPALGLISQLYNEKNHPAALIYSQRYTASCGNQLQ